MSENQLLSFSVSLVWGILKVCSQELWAQKVEIFIWKTKSQEEL